MSKHSSINLMERRRPCWVGKIKRSSRESSICSNLSSMIAVNDLDVRCCLFIGFVLVDLWGGGDLYVQSELIGVC